MKVGYARLSVGDPEGLTLQIQLDRLQEAGCEQIYSEVISGNAQHRPQWEALKTSIAGGAVTEVVALRMDRLSRSWAIGEVIALFSQPGAPRLTLLDESMDLTSIAGRTVAGVLASVAAGERERIVARSTAGLRKRIASGRRHKLAFGLAANADGFPIPDRRPWLCTIADHRTWTRAEVAVELWGMWEASPSRYSTQRAAAETFGLLGFRGGSSSVWSCNPSLRGALTGGKRDRYGGYPAVQENAFEALIEPQRHLAAVAAFLRARSGNNTPRNDKASPLSGKVTCAACGYKMVLHRLLSRPGTAWTFRCRREGCSEHNRRYKYKLLVEHCRQHLLARQPQMLASMLGAVTPPAVDVNLARQVRELETQVEDLRSLVAKRPSPGLQRELQAVEVELADLKLAAASPASPVAPPSALLQIMHSIYSGNYEVRPRGEDKDRVTIEVVQPAEHITPEVVIAELLTPDGFDRNLEMLVPQFVHSIKVQASAASVEVIDLLDAHHAASIDSSIAREIHRRMVDYNTSQG